MPIILMGVLFGLAMDYEVFLVSRMREDFVHHGDPRRAVERGFVGSARVVTAAAIIMFAVFAAFVPEGDASIQPIAFGLAVGVVIDAFLVRMTLIPAVLVMFGSGAWWIPRWLDRVLPHFDVEGEGLSAEFALADWPSPDADLAIAADDVRVAGVGGARIDVMVGVGEALVVHGGSAAERSALLLALGGRVAVTGGRLKVDGLVVPGPSFDRARPLRVRAARARVDRVGCDRRRGRERRPPRADRRGRRHRRHGSGQRHPIAPHGGAKRAVLSIVVAADDPVRARDLLPTDMVVRTLQLGSTAIVRTLAGVR